MVDFGFISFKVAWRLMLIPIPFCYMVIEFVFGFILRCGIPISANKVELRSDTCPLSKLEAKFAYELHEYSSTEISFNCKGHFS